MLSVKTETSFCCSKYEHSKCLRKISRFHQVFPDTAASHVVFLRCVVVVAVIMLIALCSAWLCCCAMFQSCPGDSIHHAALSAVIPRSLPPCSEASLLHLLESRLCQPVKGKYRLLLSSNHRKKFYRSLW